VVHAELDRCAQYRDRLVTVAGDGPGRERLAALGNRIAPNPIQLTLRSPSIQVPATAAPPVSPATAGVCHTPVAAMPTRRRHQGHACLPGTASG